MIFQEGSDPLSPPLPLDPHVNFCPGNSTIGHETKETGMFGNQIYVNLILMFAIETESYRCQ